MMAVSAAKIIGVLALQGDVREHLRATQQAAFDLSYTARIIPVRTATEIATVEALIIPGGESTTLSTLCDRDGLWSVIGSRQFLFGTCAGAIMMAKTVRNAAVGQRTLGVMDITIDRNAYGRQTDSFESTLKTSLGTLPALFIRAPKIVSMAATIRVLAQQKDTILACEQWQVGKYLLACCFHPELTSSLFHQHFLKQVFLSRPGK